MIEKETDNPNEDKRVIITISVKDGLKTIKLESENVTAFEAIAMMEEAKFNMFYNSTTIKP